MSPTESEPRLIERLAGLVQQALTTTGRERLEEPMSASLFLPEVVDSLALAALVDLIETEWDIELDDDELVPETFEDLRSLAELIAAKTAG